MIKRMLSLVLSVIMVTVLFAGCKNGNDTSTVESWIEWEEEVDGDTTTDSSGNKENNNTTTNSNTNDGGDKTPTVVQPVAPVADEKYFPQKWLDEREAYEKKNNPYNVPANLKGTTVTFATWIDHTKSEGKNAWTTFEKATGIKIKMIEIPQGEYASTLSAKVASGQSPDVFVENSDFFPTCLQVAMPLNKIKSLDLNDPIWDQDVIKYSTFGGKPYLINTKYSIWNGGDSVFFNKRAFEYYGLLTPQDYIDAGKWNMDNFIKMLTEFTALNSSFTGAAMSPEKITSSMGTALVYMKNGKFVSGANDPKISEGYSIYNKIKDAKLLGGTEKGFMDGTTAVYITGTSGLKKTGYFKSMDPDDLGVAPIPSIDGKSNAYVPAIFRAYGVCSGAKNPEGAAYFLRYFLDPLNYDFDATFLNKDCRDYFVNNISGLSLDKKLFDFSEAAAVKFGYANSDRRKWRRALSTAESAQFTVELSKWVNEINTATKNCNDAIDDVIAKNK